MKVAAWENLPNPVKTSRHKKKPPTRRATHGEIACQLRDLRKQNGYRTPRLAAEAAHINVSMLHRLERGNLSRSDHLDSLRYGKAIAALAFIYDGVKPEDILTRPVEASD